MKTIYLVRHAEYANPKNILAGRLPLPLTPKGEQQARALGEYFAGTGIQKIYSSAVHRCHQTSEIIQQSLAERMDHGTVPPLVHDQRLLETFSAYQGFWGDGLTTNWDDFFSHTQQLGGELPSDIQVRMVDFINELVNQPEDNVLICSHGDPLFCLYTWLLQEPLPNWQDITSEAYPQYQPKASVRKVILQDSENITVDDFVLVEALPPNFPA